jgi:quercetin dioxygenase-like cupin family protein
MYIGVPLLIQTSIDMKTAKLRDMKRGWLVGNFEPSLYKTNNVEVAVQRYSAGDYEQSHYHKVATEITVIVSGEVRMNGQKYCMGDIVIVEPGEATDFSAVTDTVNVVVKIPGANNDKFLKG